MAPKKVTRGEKSEKKIIISTIEVKKELKLSGKVVHIHQTWLFNMIDHTEEQGRQ
jgi:hypothetical protein